jgi:IS30 family transposase
VLSHSKLTRRERELLVAWKKEGLRDSECARRLSRHRSTIGRELKRNQIRVNVGRNDWQIIYEPLHAQTISEERKKNAWFAKQPLKTKKIYAYTMRMLRRGWSPEQIAGRLRYLYPQDPSWHICHETIYQFIYKEKTDMTKQGILNARILDRRIFRGTTATTVTDHPQPLYEYLRRKQVKRRKRGGRKVTRVRIPDRVSIHDRPGVIDGRKEFGHWEGDTLVGKYRISGLHTEYERLTSLIKFARMESIDGDGFEKATKRIFGKLPDKARQSTTLDNGLEHSHHIVLKEQYGMSTYFADPYSAWQRGGNENANLWIRYYFPKGTDFSTITEEELKDIEWELNSRPRKRLGFQTPQEVFTKHLNLP